ncbi:MAG: hypothetical protein ACREU2_06645, partial [Steroidobacteraceae bacterium]
MKIYCISALLILSLSVGADRARAATVAAAAAQTPPVAAQTPQVAAAAPDSYLPAVLSVQYTYVWQHQSALHSPYSGRLSLLSGGDTEPTNTLGIYTGWAPLTWGQLYLDAEKFTGAGVSDGTGLGGPTNGNARAWRPGLNKQFYIARLYARFMLPLGDGVTQVERGADQVSGAEAARRLELKVGRMAAPDDFDQNRYAES